MPSRSRRTMATDPADGRPWVLLPGTLCSGAVFDEFLNGLGVPRAARKVVVLNRPSIEDYAAPMSQLCRDGAVICGFSLGAIVAAHLCDCLPASQIVLFGLTPHADDPAKRDGRLALERDVLAMGGRKALAARLPPLAGPDPEWARTMILDMAEDCSAEIEAQTQLALTRPGALDALSRCATPICLLTGDQDTQSPLARAEEAAEVAQRARLASLSGLTHYALVEDPAACAAALMSVWGDL